jgi:hypothetical protein
VRGIRCDEIELRESTNTNKPTQAHLGSRGQEEGTNCSASIQTSTLDKDKVSGSKLGGQKLGADVATPGEHKPQTKPNRRKKRVSSEQGKRSAQTCITGGKTMQKPVRQNQHTPSAPPDRHQPAPHSPTMLICH